LDTVGTIQMQLAASNTTCEEDNDDIAPNSADDNDDDDAVTCDNRSVDDDIASTEKYLIFIFNSLAKSGTNLNSLGGIKLGNCKTGSKNSFFCNKDMSKQGLIAEVMFQEWDWTKY